MSSQFVIPKRTTKDTKITKAEKGAVSQSTAFLLKPRHLRPIDK